MTRARACRSCRRGAHRRRRPGPVRVAYRRLAQGNLCLGMPGVARDDPDRWALDLLGAVLGDGMSSRLFLELRERRSLAYDVSTFAATYADCGTFGVHAGFDPDQAGAVIAAILEQLERVVQEPVSAAELERARAYTRGRLELRMEETVGGRRLAGHRREPAAADPDRRRGDRAARGGHAGRHAARGAALRPPRPGAPGRAGAVPLGDALREDAGRGRVPDGEDGLMSDEIVVDLIPDDLSLARAQLDSGLVGQAEGSLRRHIAAAGRRRR